MLYMYAIDMICHKGPIFALSVFQPVDATFFHLLSNMLEGRTKHQIGRKLSVFQEDNDVGTWPRYLRQGS